MTVPPQGPYGSQPLGGGGPQWGGPPPQGSGAQPPYGGAGQPQYGQQPGGGPWPQQGWTGAPPPPNNGGKGKWILIGLALVAIIAVSIVGTVLVLRPDSGNGNGSSNTADGASEFASANDTGPANIITEDPTCEAWGKISDDLVAASKAAKWNSQDYSVPATEWTSEQRNAFEQQGVTFANAINKAENLAKRTPHRVMRELYGQFIAYAQVVIDAIPTYSATDQPNVVAANKFFSSLNEVCDSMYFRAAQEAVPLIAIPSAPSDPQALNREVSGPQRFLSDDNDVCSNWIAMAERFDLDTEGWRAIDSTIPANKWTPEQRSGIDKSAPIMAASADDMERMGRKSDNLVWEDFGVFAAQYRRAYVQSVPSYTPKYSHLEAAASHLSVAIYWACKAVS
jgi:hypothetical protein